jgi:hypothetical protein
MIDTRYLTSDGHVITEGLKVWTNDCRPAIVVIAGTHADPSSEFHQYWDGWFTCNNLDGSRYTIFNGERMSVRKPF